MTGCLRLSTTDITSDAHRSRPPCRVAWPAACAAAALASVLFLGIPGEAVAQTPGQVWAGCELEPGTVTALKNEMPTTGNNRFVPDGQIAFVVVYTMKDNDGQQFAAGPNKDQFTGPVICTNPNADVGSSFQGVGIEEIDQDDPIPNGQANTVITRDAEEVFLLRYELVGGGNPGTIEKILCHAVNDAMNCYRISPLLP